jgi:hypothetical protein
LVAAIHLLLFPGLAVAEEAVTRPDMMDPLGRYQLLLPDGWGIAGTNSKLNGFVIGNGEDSFVAVYHDGKLSFEQAVPTMTELCSCSVPDRAKVEVLSEAAYPAQLIQIGQDDQGTVVIGTVVFPEGMFGLVSVFRNEQTRLVLKNVLRQARPGPSRSK